MSAPTMDAPRIAVVGLGLHGAAIARLAVREGYRLVGAVDIGDLVGRSLADVLGQDVGSPVTVVGTVDEVLGVAERPDVLMHAAAIAPDLVAEHAERALRAGVNVLSLSESLLERDTAHAARLDAAGKSGGATFLAGGVQDTWWVHMPALAVGSVTALRAVEIVHTLDAHTLSAAVAEEFGLGLSRARFADFEARALQHPSPLGSPLRESARLIGLSVTSESVRTLEGEFGPNGTTTGAIDTISFTTEEGVRFSGTLRTAHLPVGVEHSDRLRIDAEPELVLSHTPFPGDAVTNAALVRRIPDVICAPAGFAVLRELGPARYRSAEKLPEPHHPRNSQEEK